MSRSFRGGTTQIAWRVMADMFDDGSILLPSYVVLIMFNHFGISNDELRLHGTHRGASCQMIATDKTLDLEEKNVLQDLEEFRELCALNLLPIDDQDR